MSNQFRVRRNEELPYDGDDYGSLAQLQTALRIAKQVPIDPDRVPLSWYGGSPRMPDHIQWPIANGEPMVFLAQLHCADFPAELWGGVGPREGWLLFFLGPKYGRKYFPAKVIHTLDLGPERDPGPAEAEWISSDTRKALTGAGITFPRWPVAFHEIDATKEKSRPRTAIDWKLSLWPGGPGGNPLTRSGLKSMFDSMTKWLEERCRRAEELIATLTKRISTFENPSDGVTEDQDFERRQFEYDVAIRRLPEAHAARQINATALAELAVCVQHHSIYQYPELITDAAWMRIADDLSKIKYAVFKAVNLIGDVSGLTGYEMKTYGLLDQEGMYDNYGAWSDKFEHYRKILASRLYAEDPRIIPADVRAHFERNWASAIAAEVHDGMGGLALSDDPSGYFGFAVYYSDSDRKRYRAEQPYQPLPAAPFDADNALLLQLFSDTRIMNWMWGDTRSIIFIIPRAELARGNFDCIRAIVG